MSAAITTSRLVKKYRTTRAVDGVTLSAAPGVVGLLGPNGAGKTTLMRMIATVVAPDAGSMRLLELDPADPRERVEIRRRIGYLPQAPALYAGFTPFDLVDYVAVLKEHTDRSWRRRETRRVLELVGLQDQMHMKIRILSDGMKQRVALATALIGTPELLVLDEPATGLDLQQRLHLGSLLAQSPTVIFATHNIAEMAALCQHVYVMVAGRIRFSGRPAELTELAVGQVWEDDRQDSNTIRSWPTSAGTYRHLGRPPANAQMVEPSLDDGYLLLVSQAQQQ